MSKEIKVSVVIPVYNVEKYLDECLESIINQTLNDIEIICINDGSTDKSLNILKNFEKKDSRIKIFSQENKGLGATRNNGIKNSSGKYIYFMDSDDYLEENALQELYDLSEEKQLDFIMFKLINFNNGSDEKFNSSYYDMTFLKERVGENVFDYKDVKDFLFEISVSAPGKLFNANFISNMRFPENLIFEDNLFFTEALLKAKRIYFYDKYLYNRRIRENSITTSASSNYSDSIIILNKMITLIKKLNLWDEFKLDLYNRKLNQIYYRFTLIDEKYKQDFFEKMKKDFIKYKNEYESDPAFENINKRLNCVFYYALTCNTSTEFQSLMNLYENKKQNEVKVSVIMPSYNVKPYIQESIESVINQSLKDIEIICVDAKSNDGTLEILQEYANNYPNIKLILSDEKSYGHQMNLGLAIAKGEYVGIVETDDYIDKDMYYNLYSLNNDKKVEIIKSNFYHFNETENEKYEIIDQSKVNIPTSEFTIFDCANILNGHPSIWAAIYNTDFLRKNNISFLEVLGGGWVDNPFFYETFILAKSILYTSEPYYYYRESNPNSSSNNLQDLTLPIRRMNDNLDILEKYNCFNQNIINALYFRIFWHVKDVLKRKNYSIRKDNINLYITQLMNRLNRDLIDSRPEDDKKIYHEFVDKYYVENINQPPYISIIMPIYNAEDVIEHSIKSVVNQTLKNIELICIDDGSTDNSLEILKVFEKKYPFIKVFSQNNQGSGKARNKGMNLANGEYIGFLDADDFFVDEYSLEKLYFTGKLNNATMVSGNILHDINNPGEFVPFKPMEYYTKNKIILPEEYGMPWSFYKCLFKREFILNNNIKFPDLLRGQDPVFLAEILTKIDKIHCVAIDFYAYVYYDAIDRCDTYRKLYDQLLHYKIVFDYLKEPRFSNSLKEFRKAFLWFLNHLNNDLISTSLKIIRELFIKDQMIINDLNNFYYLKFRNNPNVNKIINKHSSVISVIVAIKDMQDDITDIINTLSTQTIENIEVIFVDMGSKDSTKSIIKNSLKNINKFKLIEKENISLIDALKIGYNESSSEWLFFLKPQNKLSGIHAMEHLMDYVLLHDTGEIYTEEKLDYYYHQYILVRNIHSNYYDSNIQNEIKNKLYIKPKISVIIPVYNASMFLEESITSLLNQSFKQIELVCVNDGSKDNSLQMLKDFAKNDSRVIVIDQENAGCGAARNKALQYATGKYIYFFDPDDYILPDTFERLYKNAVINDTDLVMFKIARFRDGEPIDYSIPGFDFENVFKNVDFNYFSFNYKDVKPYVLNASFAPWTKLYKKSFLDKYDDFKFPTNIAFDDAPFHVQSMLRAKNISFIPEFFYHYRLSNPNSIINTSSNGIDIFRICDIVEKFLIENNFMSEFKNEFDFFKITQVLNYILSTHTEEYFKKAKLEFSKIHLNEKHLVDNYRYQRYKLILNSNSFYEYIIGDYNLEMEKLSNKNKLLEKRLLKVNNENDSLKKEITVSNSETENLYKSNKNLQEELLKINNENDSFNKSLIYKIEKLSSQNTNYNSKIDILIHQNNSLKEHNKELNDFKTEVLSSKSWNLTKFPRKIYKILNR